MAQEIIMPKLGLTMTEGKVTCWLKKEGEYVKAGEPVVEIETDKINSEVESPMEGYILKILVQEGETKEITAPICIVGEKGELVEIDKENNVPDNKATEVRDTDVKTPAVKAQDRIFITPI